VAATFLGGAKSRLLPLSIPFRFFISAVLFHVVMWLIPLLDFQAVVDFRGGLGPSLAAVHLVTLGVLTTTAIGASVQLLPVATRRALILVWPIKVVYWLVIPGIVLLVTGMYVVEISLLAVGAIAVTAGLVLFAALLADNLRRAGGIPVVAAFGWVSLGSLLALIALGVAVIFDYEYGFLSNRPSVALAHMILAGFGFMGMLILGFSHVLVPMFSLSAMPKKRSALFAFILAAASLIICVAGIFFDSRAILTLAAMLGFVAAAAHIRLMLRVLANGMRKRLGLSFILVRSAWGMFILTFVIGIAALHGFAGPNGPTLFAFVLLWGWLLTFLFGILQRIMPFLASMHAARGIHGAPPLLSEFAASWPLKCHAACHAIAVVGIALAIAFNLAWVVLPAAVAGLTGAIAFAWFTLSVIRRVLTAPM
jgi:hypothetical protein